MAASPFRAASALAKPHGLDRPSLVLAFHRRDLRLGGAPTRDGFGLAAGGAISPISESTLRDSYSEMAHDRSAQLCGDCQARRGRARLDASRLESAPLAACAASWLDRRAGRREEWRVMPDASMAVQRHLQARSSGNRRLRKPLSRKLPNALQ
jgi:hypothetical protein